MKTDEFYFHCNDHRNSEIETNANFRLPVFNILAVITTELSFKRGIDFIYVGNQAKMKR